MERSDWRLVGPMHIAETRKQAIEDVRFGLAHWVEYRQMIATVPLFDEVLSSVDEMVEKLNSSGLAVIGTVEDAAEQIERLEKHSGGFGTYLFMAHEWANREATLRSFELCSRLLFPEFQDSSRAGVNSRTWVIENRGQFQGEASSARARAAKEHAAERSKRDSVGTAVP